MCFFVVDVFLNNQWRVCGVRLCQGVCVCVRAYVCLRVCLCVLEPISKHIKNFFFFLQENVFRNYIMKNNVECMDQVHDTELLIR